MEQVYEDCGGANEDGGEEGRVDFAEVAGGKAVLCSLSVPLNRVQGAVQCKIAEGRKRTFAISSLFLNSPFVNVTLPFSSNSVHRSLSSFTGRTTLPRLGPSSRKPES